MATNAEEKLLKAIIVALEEYSNVKMAEELKKNFETLTVFENYGKLIK